MAGDVRAAEPADFEPLADLWFEQWNAAHAALVPSALTALRTLADFRRRLLEYEDRLHVVGPVGAPLGFYVLKGHELDQIYVAPSVQGTGVAQMLLSNAEARIAAVGHDTAMLVCTKGNERAQRFYRRNGWKLARTDVAMLDTSDGPFAMEADIFEKVVGGPVS